MPPPPLSSVIILVADGVRPDSLQAAMDRGTLPTLARLREEGSYQTITTVFPSVTGPAYTPFLVGRHPGAVGLPGLRWYDRSRETCGWPGHARSYVGIDMRQVDNDLDASARTMFELIQPSLGALSVIRRGLPQAHQLGRGVRFIARTAATHFRGHVPGWLAIDRDISEQLVYHVRKHRPRYVFAALTGIDKTSHAVGHTAPLVHDALRIVDDTAAQLREGAERDGSWETTHLWIVSDHGHSAVKQHEDLTGLIASQGHRVLAHPWVTTRTPEVAVMVSGNAMAHVYVGLHHRTRPFWSSLAASWQPLVETLLARASVDLLILPTSTNACEIHAPRRGHAMLTWTRETYSYHPNSGDPLGVGVLDRVCAEASYQATFASDYPDALVQIAELCMSPRSGDIILSAARDWDFRARYEPIPHVSSHGALHREHMLVPLLTNKPLARVPRRTVDVMPSAAQALGVDPGIIDGHSFL